MNILSQLKVENKDVHNDIQFVPTNLIDYNKDNYFSMDEGRIEALSEAIKNDGFKSVIELRKKNDGRYELIAGETRTRAMKKVYEETNDIRYLNIPAYVSNDLSDEDAHIRLLEDEMLKRVHTPFEKMQAVELLEKFYKNQKEQGKEIHGRIQSLIANTLNIKKSQIGTYQKISKSAIPEVKELLKDGNISLESANILSSLDDNMQKDYMNKASDFTKNEIETYSDSCNESKNQITFDDDMNLKTVEEIVDEFDAIDELDIEEEVYDFQEESKVNDKADSTNKKTITESVKNLSIEYEYLLKKINGVEFKKEREQLLISLEEFKKLTYLLGVKI